MKDSIFRSFFKSRVERINSCANNAQNIQEKQLELLLNTAKDTSFGRKYDFRDIASYKSFSEKVPLQSYEEIQPWISRMLKGESNVLWPKK